MWIYLFTNVAVVFQRQWEDWLADCSSMSVMDDAIDEVSLSEHEGDSGVESTNSADSMLYIRIAVPDLNIQVIYQ